ncbi:MAG: Uncharacterized protein G01um10147_333 [Microgenomates group bacterium Gr01-1014_7]|nr:MAG: Uncharacterized protein G01um10147_333 [Microgenomates group bacterium Gr01-1014_7]
MSKLQRFENIIFFLTLLFLPTQLGRHFWPDFSFVYSLPIDYLSPVFYFWDILVGLLFFIFLLHKGHINRIALNLVFFFILTQGVSLLTSVNLGAGFVRLEQYLIVSFFGIYLASINLKEVKKIIFWGLTLAVMGESALAIAQFIKGGTVGFWILGERSFSLSTPGIAKFDFYGLEFLRPYGTFPHPNVLAAFCVIVAILLRGKLTFVAASLTIFLTVSRTAILAGIVSALWLLNKKWRLLFLTLLIILLPILYTRFSSTFNFDVLSFVRREEQAEIAIKMWLQSPLLGVGLNNFIPAASDQLLAGPSRFLQPVHNIFLLALAETGIIGLTGLIVLIGYPIRKRRLLPIWLVIIFLGMFDHYFLTLPQGYHLLFLVWGISLSMLE